MSFRPLFYEAILALQRQQQSLHQSSTQASTSSTAPQMTSTTTLASTSTTALATTSTTALATTSTTALTASFTPYHRYNRYSRISSYGLSANSNAEPVKCATKLPPLRVGSVHGRRCRRSTHCRRRGYRCYGGLCLCEIGYFYSPREDACVQECEEFGDRMDRYERHSIYDYNDKKFFHTTLACCVDLCIREKDFDCVSFDWCTEKRCYLSTKGYLNVPFDNQMDNARSYVFGQRRCK